MKPMLIILFVLVTKAVSEICDYEYSVKVTNRSYSYNGITCKDIVENTTDIESDCVYMKKKCIKKCCPLHQAYDVSNQTCVDISEKCNSQVYDETKVAPGVNTTKELHNLYRKLICPLVNEPRLAILKDIKDYHLEADLNLNLNYTIEDFVPLQLAYHTENYCVDQYFTEGGSTKQSALSGLILFLLETKTNNGPKLTCMLISCFFIILTVAVYSFLPELKTLHGMVMIAYLSSFFVACLFMALGHILLLLGKLNQVLCVGMMFVICFALHATFFWLNIMCFDLWSKLRITNMAHGFSESKHVRFLMYCAYGFGVPTILNILMLALEFSDLNSELLPNFRRYGCYMSLTARFIYLFPYFMWTYVSNLVFFVLTFRRIAEIKKQTQVLNSKDTQRLPLYIKLFVVTGFNWISETVRYLIPDIPYLWQIAEMYNYSLGLIIFIIFICKKNILRAIKKRYKELRGEQQTRTTSSSDSNNDIYIISYRKFGDTD